MTLDKQVLMEIQRRMLRIRLFDSKAIELQSAARIPGSLHTSIGHEAAIVGACMAVRNDDYMTGYHRSHGHPIAKGSSLAPLMAELMGRSDGICRGKGGSMHLADFAVGSLGESGIVGAGIPIAVGAGLSAKMLGNDRVALCFFGDGASNSGPFHEALNLASVWKVPTIFVCENNRYAVSMPMSESTSVENIADRAVAYGMPGVQVDGQDALAVHAAVEDAVSLARSGGGPTLIEAKTYRFREHSELMRVTAYRSTDEISEWQARDPIVLHGEELRRRGVATKEELTALEAEVGAEVEAAVQFADSSPDPEPASAYDDIFVNPIKVRGARA